jgi:ribosomal protein S12 methylthiotransferase
MKTYHLISLGCAKNTVDSEAIAMLLNQMGMRAQDKPNKADLLLVNTCGFINPARQESIEVLTELAQSKQKGQVLVAAGCMAQLFSEAIKEKVPAVDIVIGTQQWHSIPQKLNQFWNKKGYHAEYHLPTEALTPRVAKQGGSAYLEISYGCRRQCAYCSIPLIKGTLRSRPPEQIIADASLLASANVKELVLIAQDTSEYGKDINPFYGIVDLIKDLIGKVPQIPWLRLLYTFPGVLNPSFINLMKTEPRFLNYLDIPLQHADSSVLRSMQRPSDISRTKDQLLQLREAIPDITLRTTFIVGYPTEGEKEFANLLTFLEEIRFDRVGIFPFSYEDNTPSAPLGDPIPMETKLERLDILMSTQQEISLQKNQSIVGRKLSVLVEGVDHKEKVSIGRSYRDAPEIDGLVFVDGIHPVGEFVETFVTEALEYDLIGSPA